MATKPVFDDLKETDRLRDTKDGTVYDIVVLDQEGSSQQLVVRPVRGGSMVEVTEAMWKRLVLA